MCVSVCACALTKCVYSLSWSCPPPFLHVAERFSVKQQGDCSDAGWGWSWLWWLDDGGGGQNKWVKKGVWWWGKGWRQERSEGLQGKWVNRLVLSSASPLFINKPGGDD